MSCVAIIPARAGSKGIPNKNIQPLAGIPLIAHSLKALAKAEKIDRVVVSTNGEEIAAAARAYGAEIVMRPSEISGDLASSESAVLHALDVLAGQGALPAYTCFVQCTSPLTAPEDFDRAIEKLDGGKYDSVFAACEFHYFVWKQDRGGCVVGVNHDETKPRLMRQEREKEFLEAGAFYAFNTEKFRQHKRRFFGRTGVCEIPASRVLEIDTHDDLERAERLLRKV